MNVKVYDTTNPKKKPFDMSEKGFEKLSGQFPGKFAIFQQLTTVKKSVPHIVVVDKIRKPTSAEILNLNTKPVEVIPAKRGNPKPKK